MVERVIVYSLQRGGGMIIADGRGFESHHPLSVNVRNPSYAGAGCAIEDGLEVIAEPQGRSQNYFIRW